jgi:hypothetical protein
MVPEFFIQMPPKRKVAKEAKDEDERVQQERASGAKRKANMSAAAPDDGEAEAAKVKVKAPRAKAAKGEPVTERDHVPRLATTAGSFCVVSWNVDGLRADGRRQAIPPSRNRAIIQRYSTLLRARPCLTEHMT